MGKIVFDSPRTSYVDRPVEDPRERLVRVEREVRAEREARGKRLIKVKVDALGRVSKKR